MLRICWLIAGLFLCLPPEEAAAQCNGVFAANQVCGSLAGGVPGPVNAVNFPIGLKVGTSTITGGSSTGVLYNNSGVLGADAGLTWVPGGPLTINPTTSTTTQGLAINQTGPNTGSLANTNVQYNTINITDGVAITGTDQRTWGLVIFHTLTSNAAGIKYGLGIESARTVPTGAMGDQIAIVPRATASVPKGSSTGTIFGSAPNAILLSGATGYVEVLAMECDSRIDSGASSQMHFGCGAISTGAVHGSVLDGAYEVGSAVSGGEWLSAIMLDNTLHGGVKALNPNATIIASDGVSATVSCFVCLPTYTFTGSMINLSGSFFISGDGTLLSLGSRQFAITSPIGSATPYNIIRDTAGNNAFVAGGGGSSPDPTTSIGNTTVNITDINAVNIFAQFKTGATGIKFAQYGLGVIHSSVAGVLSSSLIVSADLSITTTTCTNQFLTAISATGIGTCTTATLTSAQFANQGTTTTVLHGNAAGNLSFGAVVLTTDVTGVLPIANGGTNCSSASGTCLDNITGFSSTGFLKRTGAGTYTFTADPSDVTSVGNSDGTLTVSPTTGAVVASLALGHANTWTGKQTFSNTIVSNISPTTGWALDASANAVSVSNGSNVGFGAGNGLIVVYDSSSGGIAIYICADAVCVLVASASTAIFVASTTAPAAGKASVAFNGTSYAIYNNVGSSQTFNTALIATKATP